MNTQDEEDMDRRHVWDLLEAVEDHPQVQAWLQTASAVSVRRRRPVWALAAAAVLCVLTIGIVTYIYSNSNRYETAIGEQRDVLLADGSRITLNTNTAVTVHYSNAERRVTLRRGEALFAVKHDGARPFDVIAGATLTRAVGTEFNIDLLQSTVTVSVLEGAVRVSMPNGAGDGSATRLGAEAGSASAGAAVATGEALQFRSMDSRLVTEKADLRRIGAWRARRLEFSNTPLQEAVDDFNRYSTTRITISTPDLRSVRVSGVFQIGDTAGFVYSLQEVLRVKTYESGGEVIVTRPTP